MLFNIETKLINYLKKLYIIYAFFIKKKFTLYFYRQVLWSRKNFI